MRLLFVAMLTGWIGIATATAAPGAVKVTASVDARQATVDTATCDRDAAIVQQSLTRALASLSDAAPGQLDASIVSVRVVGNGAEVDVVATIRIAISDQHGALRAVLTGGATVAVPAHLYRSANLDRLREDALVGAIGGMFPKVALHLQPAPAPSADPTSAVPVDGLLVRMRGWLGRARARAQLASI